MARRKGCDAVYDAAQRWADVALRKDDSLFTPGRQIWSLNNINEFHRRIVDKPNPPGDSFVQKFEHQLANAPSETIQLAAEILYVHYLVANERAIRGSTKRERIRTVLGWTDTDLGIPDDLNDPDRALEVGILNPGPAGPISMNAQVQTIAEFARHCKQQSHSHLTQSLSDPWKFKQDVESVQVQGSFVQSEALLHLVHPNTFEPSITSHKERIRSAFDSLLTDRTGDIDHDILSIRERLTGISGVFRHNFDFYSPNISFLWWHSDAPDWERFTGWDRRFFEHPEFPQERAYKNEIAENLRQARSTLESGTGDWLTALRLAFGKPNNLTAWQSHVKFLDWCTEHYEQAGKALLRFWGNGESWENNEHASEAVRSLLEDIPTDSLPGKGARISIASFLAMAVDSHAYPVCRVEALETGYKLTGFPLPSSAASEASIYQHALSFFDRIIEETKTRGINLQDRLDAQSILWWISKGHYKETLPEAEHELFRRYRDYVMSPRLRFTEVVEDQEYAQNREITPLSLPAATGGGGDLTYVLTPDLPDRLTFDNSALTLSGTPTKAQEAQTYTYIATDEDDANVRQTFSISVASETLEDLAARLFWGPRHLHNIHRLLQDKCQVVFYGPPGTGKTYVALQLAQHFASAEDGTDLVQFHPSYAYEDFVEGFRPANQNGQPGFQLREGPLKRIANKARAQPDTTHVLVIDEINRGNVARVFGELYFLLEYRDRKMSLQYSEADDSFSLPDNLWFIATMNTADRSIALVDAALRRRFHFVPFFPDRPPIQGLLGRWLEREKPAMKWVADLLDHANNKLSDRHLAIGPSHFIRDDLNDAWVERVWDYSILPYIEEQLFGQDERLAEFEFSRLRDEVQAAATAANGDGDEVSPAN